MDYDEFLRRVPKVELHCHFEGTVRASTFAHLARRHGVPLPTEDVAKLYDYDTIYEFLEIFAIVDAHRPGGLRPGRVRITRGRGHPREPALPRDVLESDPPHSPGRPHADRGRRSN